MARNSLEIIPTNEISFKNHSQTYIAFVYFLINIVLGGKSNHPLSKAPS